MSQHSICQQKNTSCGSCCGIYNLRLSTNEEYNNIFVQRRKKFLELKEWKHSQFLRYRTQAEAAEKEYPRRNSHTYVCPFFSYIEEENKRLGCMIHPKITGIAHSQNASFYGAAICEGYDCPNKQNDINGDYGFLIEYFFPDKHDYPRLVADARFYLFLQELATELLQKLRKEVNTIKESPSHSKRLEAFFYLAKLRLRILEEQGITSFEPVHRDSKQPRQFSSAKGLRELFRISIDEGQPYIEALLYNSVSV